MSASPARGRRSRRALALFAVAALGACTQAPSADIRARLAAAAQKAQDGCYRLIHHDTHAFARCLRGLLAGDGAPTPERLGIEYFGWVGALNSARMGMRGAQGTAQEFLLRFRATQAALRVDDRDLCASVEGDCDARLAWMRQMEATPATEAADADEEGPAHRH